MRSRDPVMAVQASSPSYILRRKLADKNSRGEALTREMAQKALLAWYCRTWKELERRGVAERGGTLADLASQRLTEEQFHLEGIPMVEQYTAKHAVDAIRGISSISGTPEMLAKVLPACGAWGEGLIARCSWVCVLRSR